MPANVLMVASQQPKDSKMTKFRVRAVAAVAGVFLAMAGINTTMAANDPTEDTHMEDKSVTAAVDSFYSALNVMFTGDGSAMKNAWSHASDITYMGPSGEYLIGWALIEKEWDKQSAAKLGGKVVPEDVHVVVSGDVAILNCIEAGENVVNGKTERVNLRSSTIFRKEGGAWKVIGHQTDLLGYMSAPK